MSASSSSDSMFLHTWQRSLYMSLFLEKCQVNEKCMTWLRDGADDRCDCLSCSPGFTFAGINISQKPYCQVFCFWVTAKKVFQIIVCSYMSWARTDKDFQWKKRRKFNPASEALLLLSETVLFILRKLWILARRRSASASQYELAHWYHFDVALPCYGCGKCFKGVLIDCFTIASFTVLHFFIWVPTCVYLCCILCSVLRQTTKCIQTLGPLQEKHFEILDRLGRRALKSNNVEKAKAAAVQFSQADVDSSSTYGTSLKFYELTVLLIVCILFAATLNVAVVCLVYVCAPPCEKLESAHQKVTEVNFQLTISCEEHREEAVQGPAPPAACSVTGMESVQRKNSCDEAQSYYGTKQSCSSCGNACFMTCPPCPNSVDTRRKAGLVLPRRSCNLRPRDTFEASKYSVVGFDEDSASTVKKNHRRKPAFHLTRAQQRILEGTNELINSQIPCSVPIMHVHHASSRGRVRHDFFHFLESENACHACHACTRETAALWTRQTLCVFVGPKLQVAQPMRELCGSLGWWSKEIIPMLSQASPCAPQVA